MSDKHRADCLPHTYHRHGRGRQQPLGAAPRPAQSPSALRQASAGHPHAAAPKVPPTSGVSAIVPFPYTIVDTKTLGSRPPRCGSCTMSNTEQERADGTQDGRIRPLAELDLANRRPDDGGARGAGRRRRQGQCSGRRRRCRSSSGRQGRSQALGEPSRTPGEKDVDAGDEHSRGQAELAAERARLNPLGVPDKFLDKDGTTRLRQADQVLQGGRPGADAQEHRGARRGRAQLPRRARPRRPGHAGRLQGRARLRPGRPQDHHDPGRPDARTTCARSPTQNHWTQKQFDENVRGYVARQIDALPKWTAEAEKLGPNADARHARVDGFLQRQPQSERPTQTFASHAGHRRPDHRDRGGHGARRPSQDHRRHHGDPAGDAEPRRAARRCRTTRATPASAARRSTPPSSTACAPAIAPCQRTAPGR